MRRTATHPMMTTGIATPTPTAIATVLLEDEPPTWLGLATGIVFATTDVYVKTLPKVVDVIVVRPVTTTTNRLACTLSRYNT
jgi:hypothetical protein